MTFDGKITGNTIGSSYGLDTSAASIIAKIESLDHSIPDRTTTKEEKGVAINVKTQIIDLKKQLYNKAVQSGDMECANGLLEEIKTLDYEKSVIQSEIDAMKSVFTSNDDKKSVSKDGPSIFS